MPEPFNVLISSAGRRVALMDSFRDALTRLGLEGELVAADISRLTPAFHLADRAFIVPRCTDASFVPTMLELCEKQRISLVVPTIDTELAAWAAHRDDFAAIGTAVGVSSPEVIGIGADKSATHAWLLAGAFPTVRQATVDEVLRNPADWPYPVLVKPLAGSSSIGVAIVESEEHLRHATAGGEYIVQSIAQGWEHTVSVFVDRAGRCRCAVPRRRHEVRQGEVQKAVTVRSPVLEDLATHIAEALPGAFGALNIQIFHDEPTEELAVIEINPRFGGGYPLAHRAGARFTQWLIEEVAGLPSSAMADEWTDGLVMLRYDDAVFVAKEAAGL